ncbi:unnamed protein product, partial [Allacma fusca]
KSFHWIFNAGLHSLSATSVDRVSGRLVADNLRRLNQDWRFLFADGNCGLYSE